MGDALILPASLQKLSQLVQPQKYKFIIRLACLLGFYWLFMPTASGQFGKRTKIKAAAKAAALIRKDTLVMSVADSLQKKFLADSSRKDTIQDESDLKTTVKYDAKDSTEMDVTGRIVDLYGDAKVDYGTIKLTADYIRINYETNELYARGTYDSTTKKIKGKPVFQDGSEKYDAKEMRYNFKTKKGLIQGVITQQGEGNIRGEKVKKDDEDNLYIRGSVYTTCNLATPHFHIYSRRLKVIPNKQVVSGRFNFYLGEIPLPIGLPFGFFPIPQKKEAGTSGIIFGNYGEEPNGRGFFLRDFGYYWAASQYFNAVFTGQIYSKGSWGVGMQSTYTKKYRYNGSFALAYNKNSTPDEVARRFGVTDPRNDFSIRWSHSPVPHGNSSFGASVNISSNSFNQFNEQNTQRYSSNVAGSSVQYSRQFGQYGRMSSSARVNQKFGQFNQRTGKTDPGETDIGFDLSFGLNQIAPFALKGGTGRWYESFRLGVDFQGGYSINNTRQALDTAIVRLGFKFVRGSGLDTNAVDVSGRRLDPLSFNVANLPIFMQNALITGRYSVPIALPNFKVAKYFNFTPTISLQGELFTKEFEYKYLGENRVQVSKRDKLSFVNSYSFGMSMNTRVYGTVFVRGKRVEAIRHTLIPSASINYTPDLSGQRFQSVQINNGPDSTKRFEKYSRFGTIQRGGFGSRSSAAISFSLNNSFELKLRSKSDTASVQFEKMSLLDNLGIGGSYDLMADSLGLSNILIGTNARILKDINFNISTVFDPYAYVKAPGYGEVGARINRFSVTQGQGLARLSTVQFGFSKSFRPATKKKEADKTTNNANKPISEATEAQKQFIQNNPDLYVDFNVPWSVNLNYNFAYQRNGLQRGNVVQTVSMTGDFSLTPKWKFTYQTGYDVQAKSVAFTTLTVIRDLHCWEMFFEWTPYSGNNQRQGNYSFTIRAKSTLLRDLKVSRRRSFYDTAGFR